MKAIRWSGFIAFTVLTVLLVAGCLLFAGPITKSLMESTLTSINGAKADIDSVDISYSPLSININNIQITDPARPMVNTVQIGQARFALSLADLLFRKVVIEDMALNNIQVDTPRKSSGAISKVKTKKQPADDTDGSMFDFVIPDMELPDIDELINKEQLNSEKLISDLDADLDATQNNWKTIRDELQDQQRWDSYQSRYDQIKIDLKGNTAEKIAAIKDAKALSDDLKNEMAKIQQARKQFSEDNKRLGDKFKAVKTAPRDDIRRLKQQYKIDDLNTQNITQLLFGKQAAEYLALAEKWYARIKPYIEDSPEELAEKAARQRKQGMYIKFREYNPKPDFYVIRATLDASIPRGQFSGTISEISSDQSINKKPMRLLLNGKNLSHRESETLSAEFNYIDKNKGYSQFDYNITSYQLEDFDISSSKTLSLNMNRALMTLDLGTRLENSRLSGSSKINFREVVFKSNKESNGKSFSSMLASSFASINQFKLNASFSGSLHDLDIRLQSDLDNQLGDQLKAQFKQRGQEFEDKLKARIDDKLKAPLAKVEDKRQKLAQLKTDVDNKEQQLQAKLAEIETKIKEASKAATDKKKDELRDKLKSKLKL